MEPTRHKERPFYYPHIVYRRLSMRNRNKIVKDAIHGILGLTFILLAISFGIQTPSNAQFPPALEEKNNSKTTDNNSIFENGKQELLLQNTSMSKPAPVRHPGQPPHEVVFALPLRDDGQVYSGTVTFTASKPIEVEVLHTYAPEEKPDSLHGEPYHAVLPGNNSIAISHLRDLVDVPIEINGTGISSGSFDFVGNALVFHKTTGEPFTVTYTIDAILKNVNRNS
jgi:hypothetical protein